MISINYVDLSVGRLRGSIVSCTKQRTRVSDTVQLLVLGRVFVLNMADRVCLKMSERRTTPTNPAILSRSSVITLFMYIVYIKYYTLFEHGN